MQTLPLRPAAWKLRGWSCPGRGTVSEVWRRLLDQFPSLTCPCRSPHPPPFSPRPGTPATPTMDRSIWLSVTWGNAVVVIPEAPSTAVSRTRQRNPAHSRVPRPRPRRGARLSRRARGAPVGGPKDTPARFQTRGSVKNSGMVSDEDWMCQTTKCSNILNNEMVLLMTSCNVELFYLDS